MLFFVVVVVVVLCYFYDILLWFWHSFRFDDCHQSDALLHHYYYYCILTDREMVLLMLSPCSIRNYGSLRIEHTMIAFDGEWIEDGYIPQVQLELMYPDGLQYYRPTKKMKIQLFTICFAFILFYLNSFAINKIAFNWYSLKAFSAFWKANDWI